MKWGGIDYGSRRIGLAVSDRAERMALPADAISGSDNPRTDAPAILEWATAEGLDAIVVGLPMNMDDSIGPQARKSLALAETLRAIGAPIVETHDERLTSFAADELLAGHSPGSRGRKERRDSLAAMVMLQSFLDDRRRATEGPQ